MATKTEECGRKLRDVARVSYAKAENRDASKVPAESQVRQVLRTLSTFRFHAFEKKDLEIWQSAILITEELLLETLCFDFVVDSPHAELLELFESLETDIEVQEYAWSIAHDS